MGRFEMTRLADALDAQVIHKGPRCSVGALLVSLDQVDAADLRGFMADGSKASTSIARALQSLGHDVGHWAVARHRRLECSCSRRGL